jgi:hypothetical protein
MKKTLAAILVVAMLLAGFVGALAADTPAKEDITSIQANIIPSFYGYKVGTVVITYKDGTDLSGVTLDDYTVYDRGFNNPEFGPLKVVDMAVEGNTVTLIVDEGTDKVTDRSRETYGTLCTSSAWYIDKEGVLHFGSEEYTDAMGITFAPNTLKKGLQRRANLDLVLCLGDEAVADGIASTDGLGNLLEDSLWEPATLPEGLANCTLEFVDLDAPYYTLLSDEGLVPVHVIYPEGYDANRAEPYPVVNYQCGGGVCYWEVSDGTVSGGAKAEETNANNLGCNTVYDTMMETWHRLMPDAIIMSVNVHSSPMDVAALEIAGVLDYAIENWNVDPDRIATVGNSQGTLINSLLIAYRPDLIAAYVECNGNFGGMAQAEPLDGTIEHSAFADWTFRQMANVLDNEVAVWMNNGETDGANPAAQQDCIKIYKQLYRDRGYDEEWIDLFVRCSGYQSWKFKAWGETDHSVTKVVAWNYLERPYNDVTEDGAILEPGDTYTFAGTDPDYKYYDKTMDWEYTVYAESISEWLQMIFDAQG